MQNSKCRVRILVSIFVFALLCLVIRLIYMQFVTGAVYKELSNDKITFNVIDKSPRGKITDRYGRVLASDVPSYDLCLVSDIVPHDEYNEAVLKCLTVLESNGFQSIGEMNSAQEEAVVTVAENITPAMAMQFQELSKTYPCILVSKKYFRKYSNEGIASHLIGRVGKIDAGEYNKLKNYGYSIHDYIGKSGVEKLAEQHLKGTDGMLSIAADASLDKGVVPGLNVMLTIDYEMQKVLEQSLAERIKEIRENGGTKTGSDAYSGAGVVVDVNSGEILACASYPTYTIETFNSDYNDLITNEHLPLWNRAVSGIYSPGSTFKPLVALAALESNVIAVNETIIDKGVYDYYDDYKPRCWIWTEKHTTHGEITVSQAIEYSCNYFFYEAGRRTGIDTISQFASKFGLGEYTGIGLTEEAKGYVANPDNKRRVFSDKKEQVWYGADTLQAAIGQSIHSFTPIQLANYVATLANGGKRFKLHIIKSVRTADVGKSIYESNPMIEEEININKKNLNSVLDGMKDVVEDGSAKAIFDGYHVKIGGKTGTAQVGTKVSNNALFTAFAPFDNPEIAVCIVLEHGVKGANAAYVAKDLFDYYFK